MRMRGHSGHHPSAASLLWGPTSCARSSLALSPLHRPGLSGAGFPAMDWCSRLQTPSSTVADAEWTVAGCADGPGDGPVGARHDGVACGTRFPQSPIVVLATTTCRFGEDEIMRLPQCPAPRMLRSATALAARSRLAHMAIHPTETHLPDSDPRHTARHSVPYLQIQLRHSWCNRHAAVVAMYFCCGSDLVQMNPSRGSK